MFIDVIIYAMQLEETWGSQIQLKCKPNVSMFVLVPYRLFYLEGKAMAFPCCRMTFFLSVTGNLCPLLGWSVEVAKKQNVSFPWPRVRSICLHLQMFFFLSNLTIHLGKRGWRFQLLFLASMCTPRVSRYIEYAIS